jgi:hypothetical protein
MHKKAHQLVSASASAPQTERSRQRHTVSGSQKGVSEKYEVPWSVNGTVQASSRAISFQYHRTALSPAKLCTEVTDSPTEDLSDDTGVQGPRVNKG